MKNYNEVDIYRVLKNKYIKEDAKDFESLQCKASARLVDKGLDIYTEEGQELIAAGFLIILNIHLIQGSAFGSSWYPKSSRRI